MDKKQAFVIIFGVVVIAAVVVIILTKSPSATAPAVGSGANTPSSSPSPVVIATTSATAAPVPANTVVPNKGASDVPQNVAVPQVEASANSSNGSMYRVFDISAKNQQFTPDTIVVAQNDLVEIDLTAIDTAYTFNQPDYGLNAAITKGQTKKIGFSAGSVGKFTFYCASCGGPSRGPVGYIIVTAQ